MEKLLKVLDMVARMNAGAAREYQIERGMYLARAIGERDITKKLAAERGRVGDLFGVDDARIASRLANGKLGAKGAK